MFRVLSSLEILCESRNPPVFGVKRVVFTDSTLASDP